MLFSSLPFERPPDVVVVYKCATTNSLTKFDDDGEISYFGLAESTTSFLIGFDPGMRAPHFEGRLGNL